MQLFQLKPHPPNIQHESRTLPLNQQLFVPLGYLKKPHAWLKTICARNQEWRICVQDLFLASSSSPMGHQTQLKGQSHSFDSCWWNSSIRFSWWKTENRWFLRWISQWVIQRKRIPCWNIWISQDSCSANRNVVVHSVWSFPPKLNTGWRDYVTTTIVRLANLFWLNLDRTSVHCLSSLVWFCITADSF